ncbi:MAG TPA: glycosyltransferase family 2 protein [Candidatus Chromulinivoraceae bacterium]|nr:glycosyltransferase family 2 protein [Candidatus Chromulinivoraceae bacterium]
MAKADILLTFWGDVELLKKAVESVVAQTEKDWHLFVLDDCYPSDEPAKYFANLKDKRITYYRHPKNIGITKNFNYAVKKAKAPYCILLGCDDIMLPNYLETALKNIGEADFYQPSVDVMDGDGTVYLPLGDRIKRFLQPKKSGIYQGEKLAASLSHGNWLYFPSILWKTATIKKYGFNDRYKIAEDVVLEMDIIKDGGRLYFDTATTFQYRRFAKSLSSVEKSKGGVRFDEEDEVYDHLASEFKKLGWNKAARAAAWRVTSRLHRALN